MAARGSGSRDLEGRLVPGASARLANGHYSYSAASSQTPVWVTAQALTARHAAAVSACGGAAGAEGRSSDGDGDGSAGGVGAGDGAVRAGARGGAEGSENGGNKGGEDRGPGGDESGSGSDAETDGAPVAESATDAPGTVEAEQAAARTPKA